VTDAYLLALAKAHGGKLATLDGGIAALLPAAKEQQTLLEFISA
jgi:predicted nucleic acid-binding protein